MVREAAITVAVALIVALPLESDATTHRFAVVVGANQGTAVRARLHHAVRDARKMASVLHDLGGVQHENLTLLVEDPRALDVLAALDEVDARAQALGRRGEEVAVVFYYSGHATTGALELTGTRLPLSLLRDRLIRSPARVRLAVLDACHSGAAIRAKGGQRNRRAPVAFSLDDSIATEGYAILTSSAGSEQSQESDELLGSFFTHHLVSGLRGAADANSDRQVSLNEAYRYAYERTLQHTARRARVVQHPTVDLALRGSGDLVLTALEGPGARLRLPPSQEGARWILYAPSQGLVVAEIDEHAERAVSVVVPAGEIEVYRRSGTSVSRGTVSAAQGEELTLATHHLEEVSLTAYLAKGQAGLSVQAGVGVQSFLSQAVRVGYVTPAPVFAVGFRARDIGVRGFDLAGEFSFTSVRQEIDVPEGATSQRMTQIQLGLGLLYRFDFGNLSVSAGPRVAYLYLDRNPSLVEAQSVSTVSAGGALGVAWRFSQRVSLGVEGRGNYVPLPLEDVGRDQWMVEVLAAASYHF